MLEKFAIILPMALEKGLEKELDELKFYRGSTFAAVVGVVGSLLTSFKTLPNVLICCGIGAIIILVMILVPLTLKINDKIEEIKKT